MDISLREVAALLGRSPRAVRSRIARGELRARKVGKSWRFSSHDLPLTEPQRQALTERMATAQRALAAVAPPNLAATRNPTRRRSIRDLAAFVTLRDLLRTIQTTVQGDRARFATACRLLRSGVLTLAAAEHEFDAARRRLELQRARQCVARALGALLVDADDSATLAWCDQLEDGVLRPIGGMLRWTERRLGGPGDGHRGRP